MALKRFAAGSEIDSVVTGRSALLELSRTLRGRLASVVAGRSALLELSQTVRGRLALSALFLRGMAPCRKLLDAEA